MVSMKASIDGVSSRAVFTITMVKMRSSFASLGENEGIV